MTTKTDTTIEQLIATHATDLAFVAEEEPATDLNTFTQHLVIASERLENADDLEAAATYLADAQDADDDTRPVLIRQATRHFKYLPDMVYDYKLMVED